jgi:hypothetical protein
MKRTGTPPHVRQIEATDSRQVSEDLRTLKAEVEKLKSDRKNKFAAVLGIIGGLMGILSTTVTLPKTIGDYWFQKPKIMIVDQGVMALKYQNGDATFTLSFPFFLKNDGNKDDIIREASGQLNSSSHPDERLEARGGEIAFYDKGSVDDVSSTDKVPLPLQVGVGTSAGRYIFTSIRFDKDTFTRAGDNRLNVILTSFTGKQDTLSYCFYLDDMEISELQTTAQPKRFHQTTCGEQ